MTVSPSSRPFGGTAKAPEAWYLTGPTAVGKSAIAIELAEQLGGEIISVDSMQVYRGLDIGTAKPSAAERARVPHHLIDVTGLEESFDAARFVELANAADAAIRSRERIPIYCGGTGFYLKALLFGIGHSPPADAELRARLESAPLGELLAELKQTDPETFARIDQQNPRRVIRALEVIRLTGRPYSEQQATWAKARLGTGHVIAFTREPADLRARIDLRVDEMFSAGLVDEVKALLNRGLAGNKTAMQAIGYRQVVEHLQGERPLPETIQLVKTRTWQFARRQLTWLRHQMLPTWVNLEAGSSTATVVASLLGQVRQA
ncbi:tRNA (adenosine(37)-N6)-dimethylallyltransferase MiaA [bacterium]|nr:tRNA (adenosine(37)-N6)-dimethylallyltransferase MiaA [bacterium]